MSKIDMEKYEELYEKIRQRMDGDNIEQGEEYLSALELDYISRRAIAPYNAVLRTKVAEDVKKLNGIVRRSRILRKKVPYISSITPSIDEKGNQKLIVTFIFEGRCVGMATINKELNINFDFLRQGFSDIETSALLGINHTNYIMYFNALDSFSLDYPGIALEFGPEGSHANSCQELDDGFMDVKIDLNSRWDTYLSFVKLEDLNLARTKIPEYGELYDFVENFKPDILKNFKVDESKLNPLFKAMVEKHRALEREERGPERVLTV